MGGTHQNKDSNPSVSFQSLIFNRDKPYCLCNVISKGTEVSYSGLSTGNYKEGCFWTVTWEAKIANYYLEEFMYHVKRLGVILGLQDLKEFSTEMSWLDVF